MSYYSNMASMSRAQSAYDNMEPPDEYCPACGREASCDCICDGSATAEELEDAALELEIDRIEYYKGDDMMNMSEASQELNRLYPAKYNTVKMEVTRHHNGNVKAECSLYVDGMNWFSGPTWEEAFTALAAGNRTEEEIFLMAA